MGGPARNTRTRVVGLMLLLGALVAALAVARRPEGGASTSRPMAGRLAAATTVPGGPATTARGGARPRQSLDPGGFGVLTTNLPSWKAGDSLQQIARAWDRPGVSLLKVSEAPLESARRAGDRGGTIRLHVTRAMLWNSEGQPDRAARELDDARKLADADDVLRAEWLCSLLYLQGVTAMRRGENENCIDCRGEGSCVLPIAPTAVHTKTDGSRAAIGYFTRLLEEYPDDLDIRWLLNLAHMTLGEYPDKVDPRYLVPLDHFVNSERDIGRFRDVAHLAGVNRLNQAGSGIFEDLDGDGLFDLVVSSFDPTQPLEIYRNRGDGTFEPRGASAGVADQLGGMFCVQADYNNDGRMDLFVARGAWLPVPVRPSLLRNDGDGKFTDVTREAGLIDPVNSNSATWADYDNDGWLDLFVCCEIQPNRLYRNRGDGTFEEVAGLAGLRCASVLGRTACCKGATWIDYDNDDDPDLFLTFRIGDSALFRNEGDGTFTDATRAQGIDGPREGFSCWAFDYDNDGWLDIFATCYDRSLADVVHGLIGEPHRRQSNRLFHNRGGRGFEDVAKAAGLDMVFGTMGSNHGDFNNDGFLDMYLGTGDPSIATLIPNRMLLNDGGERFVEITGKARTGHLQKGHGVSCADWDRDGDVDVFVQTGGVVNGDKYHNVLFQNPGQGNHWLSVKLVGKTTNRAAIGARIKVTTAGAEPRAIYRHVSSGSSFGANPLEQHIGLGGARKVAALEVRWPTSQTTQILRDIDVDQAIEVVEHAGTYRKLQRRPIALPREE
ncbi:MAG: FG-GAP-like repeat-containing protein [Isosphaeraceae bacterium]